MDYDALAARVEEDAADFGAWSKLLAVVEETSVAHPERVASTFEAFLAKFPLCFGYWCKYAELKQKLGEAGAVDASDGGAAEVYARALEAVPLSVELWKAYTAHVKATTAGQASDQLRAAYVRATEMVGHDSAAAGLWDAFMEFEADRGDPESVCTVFRNMLRVDTSGRTDELWKRLKMLCKSYRCNEICSDAERLELLERYNVAKKTGTSAAEDIEASSSGRVAGMKELQEQRQMEQLLTEAEKAKNDLINSRLQRQHYEAGVRRWYFHVKPLDDAQLNNWRDYLTLEADRPPAGGDEAARVAKVRGLFERCLVPCALYSEFWIRYVSWARTHCGATDALAVATRAATVFLPRRPDVLGVLAMLLESAGRPDDARSVHEAVYAATSTPEARAAGALLLANFERRAGGADRVDAVYARALADGASPDVVRAHAARYHGVVRGDLDRARAELDAAVAASPGNAQLWHAKAQVEASRLADDTHGNVYGAVAAVYEAALADDSAVPLADRGDLWAQYRACANDLCDDAGDLLKIAKAYARWRTRADVEAAPLAPAPKRKRKPAAPAAPAAPAEAPPAKKQAASELLGSYGAYAAYGAE